jgi:hypothetical protein
MKPTLLLSLAVALVTSVATASAQPRPKSNQTVYRAGDWFVVRSTQPATGTVTCAGFYIGQDGVQLSRDSLIVKVPGELQSVGVRFDEQPARALRPAEKIEQQIGGVMLAGPEFAQLRRSKTLRVDVTTAQGRSSHTLKVEGLDATLSNIHAGCPLPAVAERAERARLRAREKALAARCSPEAIARMRANGMHELRIRSSCPGAAPLAPAASAAPASAPAPAKPAASAAR